MKSLCFLVSIGLLLVLLVDAVQFNGNVAGQYDQCPSWTIPVNTTDGNITCECGDDIGGVVSCDPITLEVHVLKCYCVTYGSYYNQLVVGACPYSCFFKATLSGVKQVGVYSLPKDSSNLSEAICGPWNRQEQLCSRCKEGFGPPILTYDFGCIKCNETDSAIGWVKLVAAGFLPQTMLLFLVILLRLSFNSPKLIGFIFFAQLVASAPVVYQGRNFMNSLDEHLDPKWMTLIDIVWAFYGLFNLDFFYTILPPFCIPGLNTVGKLSAQLVVALYPLLLAVLTYILVELHARDMKIFVYLWKPFHKCFVRYRREGNIQTTIVDAFATIFQLSYVKILWASTDLITFANLYNVHGDFLCLSYPYMAAHSCTFHRRTWPVVGAIFVLLVYLILIIFSLLLMLFYPMRCFRKCLSKLCCCRGRTYLMFQTFMDCYHGHYKDGTNGTRDYRYVAGVYFLIRSVLSFVYAFATQLESFLPIASGIVVTGAMFIALIQPYKNRYKINNITDPLFLFLLGLLGISFNGFQIGLNTRSDWVKIGSCLCIAITMVIPLIYIGIVIVTHLLHTTLAQRVVAAIKSVWQKCRYWREIKQYNGDEDEQQVAQIHTVRKYGPMDDF